MAGKLLFPGCRGRSLPRASLGWFPQLVLVGTGWSPSRVPEDPVLDAPPAPSAWGDSLIVYLQMLLRVFLHKLTVI